MSINKKSASGVCRNKTRREEGKINQSRVSFFSSSSSSIHSYLPSNPHTYSYAPFLLPPFSPFLFIHIIIFLFFFVFSSSIPVYIFTCLRVNQHFHLFVVATNFETWNIHELNLVLVSQCFTITTSYMFLYSSQVGWIQSHSLLRLMTTTTTTTILLMLMLLLLLHFASLPGMH